MPQTGLDQPLQQAMMLAEALDQTVGARLPPCAHEMAPRLVHPPQVHQIDGRDQPEIDRRDGIYARAERQRRLGQPQRPLVIAVQIGSVRHDVAHEQPHSLRQRRKRRQSRTVRRRGQMEQCFDDQPHDARQSVVVRLRRADHSEYLPRRFKAPDGHVRIAGDQRRR